MVSDDVNDAPRRVQRMVQCQRNGTVIWVGVRIPGRSPLLCCGRKQVQVNTTSERGLPLLLLISPSIYPLSEGSSSSFATGPSTVFTQSATLTSPPLTHLFIRVNVGILARHFRDGSRLRTTATAEHGAGDCFPLQGTEKHRNTFINILIQLPHLNSEN